MFLFVAEGNYHREPQLVKVQKIRAGRVPITNMTAVMFRRLWKHLGREAVQIKREW